MTPQKILSDMMATERDPFFGEDWDPDLWNEARKMIERSVHFEFGDIRPTQEHLDFAEQLIEHGAFRLPFQRVLYTGRFVDSVHIGIAVEAAISKDTGKGALSWCAIIAASPNQGYNLSPISLADIELEDLRTSAGVAWSVINKELHKQTEAKDSPGYTQMRQTIAHGLRIALGCTVLLMAKEIGQRIEPAPAEKIQAKRIAQGRPPIYPRTVVFIRPQFRTSFVSGEPFDKRGSPKMHWRRGHFRKLHGSERIVPVAPALVNAGEGAAGVVAPKSYQVGGSSNG